MVCYKADYDEVLRLAGDGVNHDALVSGDLSDWLKWKYKAYHETGDKGNVLTSWPDITFSGVAYEEKRNTH